MLGGVGFGTLPQPVTSHNSDSKRIHDTFRPSVTFIRYLIQFSYPFGFGLSRLFFGC
jgi:hypothetical protein